MDDNYKLIQDAAGEHGLEVVDCETVLHHYMNLPSFCPTHWQHKICSDMERVVAYCKAWGKPLEFSLKNIENSYLTLVLQSCDYKNPSPRQLALEFVNQGVYGKTVYPSRLCPFITINYDALGKYIMSHYKVSGGYVFED